MSISDRHAQNAITSNPKPQDSKPQFVQAVLIPKYQHQQVQKRLIIISTLNTWRQPIAPNTFSPYQSQLLTNRNAQKHSNK